MLTYISEDYNAFRDSVMKRSMADKLALVRELEQSLFAERFTLLRNKLRNNTPLSLEEITKEVEVIRNERMEQGNKR